MASPAIAEDQGTSEGELMSSRAGESFLRQHKVKRHEMKQVAAHLAENSPNSSMAVLSDQSSASTIWYDEPASSVIKLNAEPLTGYILDKVIDEYLTDVVRAY